MPNFNPFGGSNRGFMPNLNNNLGNDAPSWAINNLGNGTYQGSPNQGSNNGYIGPLNGQTMGNNNMRVKTPRPSGHVGPGAQNTFGVDAFGFPITSQSAASGVGLQQLNAYRDYNQAVQAWIDKTGFTGEGGYSAFQLANPGWTSQYGPMGPTGPNQSGSGFGSGQSWSPSSELGTMPNAQGQLVPSIGNPTPGAYGQPQTPRLPPIQAPGSTTGQPVNYGSGTTMPTTPSAPTGLQQGQSWGGNNGQR